MNHPVEIVGYERGEARIHHVLSRARDRGAVVASAAGALALIGAAMMVTLAVCRAAGLVLHAPTFFVAWVCVGTAVAIVAGRRAARRSSRFVIGSAVSADAFAPCELDLVRRGPGGYELGLTKGMTGVIEVGTATLPIEAMTDDAGVVRVPLADARARVDVGGFLFVVEEIRAAVRTTTRVTRSARVPWRAVARLVAAGAPTAALMTLFASTPVAAVLRESDMRSSISPNATPLQIELKVHQQAQRQTATLHQCFDPLPRACHRSGYVGVGLRLAKTGEIEKHWVARSTFGADCPVNACMENVIAGWFFETIPEAMSLVLPVQVLRTNKPFEGETLDVPVTLISRSAMGDDEGDAGLVGFAGR